MSCCTDRQRTIRELEVGKTLYKEADRWVIKHQADDYKTGRAYGQRPPMVIAPHIYSEVRPLSALRPLSCCGDAAADIALVSASWAGQGGH